MKVKFSEKEFNFLTTSLLEEESVLKSIIIDKSLELNYNLINEIRDWAAEKQQIIGFDKNYELTKEGEILQGIIDKLYY